MAGFKMLGYALGFATSAVLARYLGASLYGVYSFAAAAIGIASTVFALGTGTGIVRFVSLRSEGAEEQAALIRSTLLLVGGLAALGMLTAVWGVAHVSLPALETPGSSSFLRLVCWAIPALVLTETISGVFRGLGAAGTNSLFTDVLPQLGRLVAILGVISLAGPQMRWVAVALVGSAYVVFAAAAVVLRVKVPGVFLGRVALPRELLFFSAPILLTSLLRFSQGRLELVVFGFLAPAAALGVFSIASKVAVVGTILLNTINVTIAPSIARASGDAGERLRLYRSATGLCITFALVWFPTLYFFAPFVLGIFGPQYSNHGTVLQVLAGAMCVSVSTGPVNTTLVMSGHSKSVLANATVGVVVGLLTAIVLVPRWGAFGGAIATLAEMTSLSIAALVQLRRVLQRRLLGRLHKRLIATGVVALGVALPLFHLLPPSFPWTVSVEFLYLAIFLGTAAWAGTLKELGHPLDAFGNAPDAAR